MRYAGCIYLILALWYFGGCKEEDTPANPYTTEENNPPSVQEPDPNSITGLHKNIFSVRCANPGCHDGTFEPDFRTVQSSWSTLVYMNVNKLTVDSVSYFNYRVVPFDTAASFIIERLTTPTSDYMPSNGIRLSAQEIGHVQNWIMNGAKDPAGNVPVKPNLPPNVLGYIAVNSSFARLDTIRVDGVSYNPFIAPANAVMYIPFSALDTADGTAATDPANFTVSRIRFSDNADPDNFSSAISVNATWMSPIPFGVWQVTVNTSQWISGTTVYFRIYVNDGFQVTDTEFPRNASPVFYKSYYAFTIQ